MKRVLILMKNGQEEVEALTPVDLLRRAGISVAIVSCEEGLRLQGAHGIEITADVSFEEIPEEYDAIYLPGGLDGATAMAQDEAVLTLVKETLAKGKMVAALCAAPIVLEAAGVLSGRCITCYPGFEIKTSSARAHSEEIVVVDDNLITSRGPATAMALSLVLVEKLIGFEARGQLEEELLYDRLCKSMQTA
uniref:DJ-1 family glyoxalase III n=1 Tax=Ndongobacter massiliensis TaxID=1871025 RepID=UPI000931BA8E|nr:DJ-1 family glyoxalase III [Ndongobacter massiliensis]